MVPTHHRRELAKSLGIHAEDIDRRVAARGMTAQVAACHARFATACAINELVNEQPAGAVAETWGASGVFKGGKCPLARRCCL